MCVQTSLVFKFCTVSLFIFYIRVSFRLMVVTIKGTLEVWELNVLIVIQGNPLGHKRVCIFHFSRFQPVMNTKTICKIALTIPVYSYQFFITGFILLQEHGMPSKSHS